MTGRRWILITLASIAAVAGVFIVNAYVADPYGVLRDPTGRKIRVYSFERPAKFFMNRRYVPANFDGLIIGPSSSVNWDIPVLAGARMYNNSLEGGDATEEQILVNQSLSRSHFKIVVAILYPSMTSQHVANEGMDKIRSSEDLCSFHMLYNELGGILTAFHYHFHTSNSEPDGTMALLYTRRLAAGPLGADYFKIDPLALEQYRATIESLRARGATIVYVVPPVYEPEYEANRASYQAWLAEIRTLMPPAPVIDLDSPEYLSLRSEPGNYMDPFHMEAQGTRQVSEILMQQVPQVIASKDGAGLVLGETQQRASQ